MRTPLERGFRRISSGFGFRRHPIAGYRKMHQGMDFAAVTGTPVMAPADGVVVEARRWGGYGNWLRIRHANGLDSGYGHLSRYASGIRAGQRVRRARSSPMSAPPAPRPVRTCTMKSGATASGSIRPAVKHAEGTVLAGADLAAFRAEKARIDRIIAQGGERKPATIQAQVEGLRPAQG
jgi:hypothetical protein